MIPDEADVEEKKPIVTAILLDLSCFTDIFCSFSSYIKIVQTVAWMFRFHYITYGKSVLRCDYSTSKGLQEAEIRLIICYTK